MKTLTSVILATAFLTSSAVCFAESPVNSTSTKQVAKEQLHNSGHIIDDCRVKGASDNSDCLSQQQLNKQNTQDQNMMKHTGQDDRVKHQDINKNSHSGVKGNITTEHDDAVLKSSGERDLISEPANKGK